MAHLQADEIARYRAEGWLMPQWRLPAEQVATLQAALTELLRRNPGVRPEKLVSAHIDRASGAGAGFGAGPDDGPDNGEGVRGVAAFLDLARDPSIVELVSGVIGDDVILWGAHVFCKPAGEGYETPWHQDGHYWPIRPLATCTVWLALEPSTRANGCLRVIPGSHRNQVLHPHLHEDRVDLTLQQRLADGAFDETQAVHIELQPGQMSLHDVFMIHGAAANTSPQRRTGVALRYMPASAHFDRSLRPVHGQSGVAVDFSQRPLWLLKGVDSSGRNDFTVGHRL